MKKESCKTLRALRNKGRSMTNETLISSAPRATAFTPMPLRPRTENRRPTVPVWWRRFSPTTATVDKPVRQPAGFMAPAAISCANSTSRMWQARCASAGVTASEVEVSEADCATMNTLMPACAKVVKMRRLTPTTPTMDIPLTVTKAVSPMEEMPRMRRELGAALRRMTVCFPLGLKVLRTKMGILRTHTGKMVGG